MKPSRAKPASGLLVSAQEFLIESLKNFSDHKLRFAIVHAVTATELILKEKLLRLNPALILRNIDTKAPQKEPTVSLSALPQRLANLSVLLGSKQCQLIATIVEWRNQIVHHIPAFNNTTVQQQLPQLLEFLANFLRTELGTPLETFLPKTLYKVAHRLLTDWKKAVVAAQARAIKEGGVLPDICPKCGSAGVMCLRSNAVVHCHLCEAALYRCDRCDSCGRRTVISYEPGEGENFCDECIDAFGDQYVQMQIDIARGK